MSIAYVGESSTRVGRLSQAQKVAEAISRSIPLLPHEAGEVIAGLVSPESMAIVCGTLVLWAGSHLFGVGEIVDLVLLVAGAITLGKSVWDLASELSAFARLAVDAQSEAELDEAAKHFAKAATIGGVDVLTALLLRKGLRDVRARPSWRPTSPGLLRGGAPPPVPPGRFFYRPKISRVTNLPYRVQGMTDWFGDIYVSRLQSMSEQQVTLFHELVHSVLSPKFKLLRQFRSDLRVSGYHRIALLKYLEEALAEGYGQFRVRGLGAALKGITFPIGPPPYGYVTISQLASEGLAIGAIVVGGDLFRVHFLTNPPDGFPPPDHD